MKVSCMKKVFFFLTLIFLSLNVSAEVIDGVDITALQKMLKAKGYYKGDVHGVFTNETANALSRHEEDLKLKTNSTSQPLRKLKKVGNRVSFHISHKIDTTDCVSLYMFRKCGWVTYKFKFSGKITKVDRNNRSYTINVTDKRLVPKMQSMWYIKLKSQAMDWAENSDSEYVINDKDIL